jgi:transketolase
MPSWDLFDRQTQAYRREVLGDAPVFVVEAGSPLGWERYTGRSDRIFALDGFGVSAPPAQVYAEMGLTPERVAERIVSML